MKLKKKDQGFSTASLKRRKFFSHVGKKGKFFRRERNSRAGEFDKHQMEWDECILGRQPIAVSLKHRFQQFTSVRQLLPKDFHIWMKSWMKLKSAGVLHDFHGI